MLKLIYFLRGYVILEFCGASPEWVLNRLTTAKVAFWDVQWIDSLTLRVKVFRNREATACALAEAAMCDSKVISSCGIYQSVEGFFRRPILLAMVFLCIMSILLLPCFVFFFEVHGNETIPEQLILRELEQAGVRFGIFGPGIYPRRVKDHMIEALPKLQWVTVEQHGCRAMIVVRERDEIPQTETKKGFANVIASQSGIITKQSVYTGQPQFQVGDTVLKGEILVSGVIDLERTYLIERANAEVFARTWRKIPVCLPCSYTEKVDYNGHAQCIWLILGKRRIKIFGNSGISYGSCDKMINTRELTLPRGLSLPVSLEIETFSFYEDTEQKMEIETAKSLLAQYAESFAAEQMRAGEILREEYDLREQDGIYCLEVTLECHEMIAEVVEAKWKKEEFVND